MGAERFSRREVGTLKPNAELRKALDEADRCMNLFNEGNFIDYFQSINGVYLNKQGAIEGPTSAIGTELGKDMGSESSTLFELSKASGGINVSLKWEDVEDNRPSRKNISLTFKYESSSNGFWMSLFAGVESRFGVENKSGLLNTGMSLQRNFWLNPEASLPKYIDDLLLTFTDELFESEIL